MLQKETGYSYIIRNEKGEQIAQYNSTAAPPLKGDVIQLKGIPNYDHVEVLSVTWLSSSAFNTVTVKVKPATKTSSDTGLSALIGFVLFGGMFFS